MRRPSPVQMGLLLGYMVPMLVFAPSLFLGRLAPFFSGGRSYPLVFTLLPFFFLLLIPGAGLGFLASKMLADRRDVWRFDVGLLGGGSVAGSLFLWAGNMDYPFLNRVGVAVFGGIMLCGFWMWIGALLGAATRLEKAKIGKPSAGDAP